MPVTDERLPDTLPALCECEDERVAMMVCDGDYTEADAVELVLEQRQARRCDVCPLA